MRGKTRICKGGRCEVRQGVAKVEMRGKTRICKGGRCEVRQGFAKVGDAW